MNWPPAETCAIPPEDIADCWAIESRRLPLALESAAGEILTPAEMARANRFRFRLDRQAYLASHIGLRLLLGRYLHTAPGAVAIETDEHGRPYLAGRACDLRFNLSHSSDLALVAVVTGTDVGIDVEALRIIPDVVTLARRFFAGPEIAAIEAAPSDQRMQAFFQIWARKEAVVKALGLGLAARLDRFCVGPPDAPPALTWLDATAETGWLVADLRPADGYSAALAVRNRRPGIRCHTADWGWLANSTGGPLHPRCCTAT